MIVSLVRAILCMSIYLQLFGEEEEGDGDEYQKGTTDEEATPPHADPMAIR